ncbi:MAG: NADH-quinone oxidoreductase subunit H [Thaumarchaeota archaeon]|nr:NADH-quinone oxidoreductase subunit H [Nitrososphaerota archaeon]
MIWKILEALIFPGAVFILTVSLFYEWIDRKLYARLQNRVGPHLAGPFGLFQPAADFIKLLSKEDIIPAAADRFLFTLTPILAPTLILLGCMFLPVAGLNGIVSFNGDLIVIIALMSFCTITIYLAGEGSNNRFASIGATRAALQLIGYEIPLTLALLCAAISTGSLSLRGIVEAQMANGTWLIAGPQLIGFAIFVVASQAEMERIPFDIPEAEQEIVAGWSVEYTGRRLGLFRLTKDLELFLLSGLGATLFLGGPLGPLIPGLEPLLHTIYFLVKSILVLIVFTLVRTVFARLRIDQMISFSWKYLMPLAIFLVIITEVIA